MGTPAIAANVFETLVKAGYEFVALITNEDKPVGRKRIIMPTPCKEVALRYGIPVYQPHRIKTENEFLKELDCDLIVTMAYGQIVPEEVLNHPRLGCVNLHASLLPKLRGAAPIQRAIMNGDKVTGVTLMEMVKAMDAGKMYDKIEVAIEDEDNYTSLCDKLSNAAGELILRALPKLFANELPGEGQDESEVTYAAKILPENERLCLSLTALEVNNAIRGMSETPGAYFLYDGLPLKVFRAHIVSNEVNAPVGHLEKKGKSMLLQLKDGVLSLDDVQLSGKKRMDAASFVNGTHDSVDFLE